MCVNWGGGEERAVASPGGCMWVHMHPVHIPVQPLNYSFNVNILSCTCACSVCMHYSDSLVII